MTNMKKIALAVSWVSMTLFAPLASAITYNLAQDWSATNNPNGQWSYLRDSSLLPYQPTTCCGLPVTTSFAPSSTAGSFLPVFFRPGAAGTDFFVHSYDGFNGGSFVGEATLAWTALTGGIADVSGYFYYAQNPQQRSDDVIVRLGSTVLGSATISYLNYFDSAHQWAFSFSGLAVSPGDKITVTFQRTPGFAPGSTVGGNVIIASAVPEPNALIMILAGLGIVGLARASRSPASRGGEA